MPGFEWIGKEEKDAVSNIFDEGGFLAAQGANPIRKHYHVRELELDCSNYFDCKHALAVSSGTAAIKIALKAVGVKEGDEVITQAFNFIATIEAILDCGAVPVIANVDESLNMDPTGLEKLITKKTKAFVPVHMLGVAVKMEGIMSIANSENIVAVASASHRDELTNQWLVENGVNDTISIGSSLKFCLLAAGEADVYPRFGPTMEWDTAAGDAVLRAAGGKTTKIDKAPFVYGKPDYLNGPFIAWGGFS